MNVNLDTIFRVVDRLTAQLSQADASGVGGAILKMQMSFKWSALSSHYSLLTGLLTILERLLPLRNDPTHPR